MRPRPQLNLLPILPQIFTCSMPTSGRQIPSHQENGDRITDIIDRAGQILGQALEAKAYERLDMISAANTLVIA